MGRTYHTISGKETCRNVPKPLALQSGLLLYASHRKLCQTPESLASSGSSSESLGGFQPWSHAAFQRKEKCSACKKVHAFCPLGPGRATPPFGDAMVETLETTRRSALRKSPFVAKPKSCAAKTFLAFGAAQYDQPHESKQFVRNQEQFRQGSVRSVVHWCHDLPVLMNESFTFRSLKVFDPF